MSIAQLALPERSSRRLELLCQNMVALEVFLQFATVFVGAFLAFVLENVRERRQLKSWADDYLQRVRLDLQESSSQATLTALQNVIASYEAFVEKTRNETYSPDEADWNSLMWLGIQQYATYQALTESAAARVLPAELVQSIDALDDTGQAVQRSLDLCHQAWEQHTVPVVFAMQTPVPSERRGLEYVAQLLALAAVHVAARHRNEARVLELLTIHDLGR